MSQEETGKNQIDKATRLRIGGLRRFATAFTIFNILGHTVFGFEQSYAQPLVALATGYTLEILLEIIQARSEGRNYKFSGGFSNFVDFLLPAHISSLAVAMLTYANDRLWVIAFAVAVAIGSKMIFQVQVGRGKRHYLNPSNFGITVTLLLFSWVGVVPPYQFTENLDSYGDWLLPAFIICTGSFLNFKFTKRLPLIAAWVSGFFLQALLRNLLFDQQLSASLLPMTGMAFIVYTFYMVTDPATTPQSLKGQILFGAGNALCYGVLMYSQVVFGLFFALTIVCLIRGSILAGESWVKAKRLQRITDIHPSSQKAIVSTAT